jgi:DNA-directed RNA polymerase specialized sigma24 family protein
MSLEEISTMTDIPIGTLGSRLTRARKQLKQLLEGADKT